jgi:cytochrome c-type biogenesis protein
VSFIESFALQLSTGGLGEAAAFGVAFVGGMVAGFGPCVLPMIPAVFGYVTGQVAEAPVSSGAAWGRSLALSATFVLGMSLVFAAIGAVAGALGRALIVGAWAYYVVAAICVVLGLQLLGVINLPMDALNRFLPARRPGRGGFTGAFLLGLLFGVVATPCSTPILAAIATIAAARGSAVLGALMLFVYGLGKGVPLMLVGLAAGSLPVMRSLSRATGVLTKIGGVAMLGAAAYLVWIA